jgi:hypothetical protein
MKNLITLFTMIIVTVSFSHGQQEIYYDNDTYTGWQEYFSDGYVGVHFSPDGPCEVITMKFYLKYEGVHAGEFTGALFGWDLIEPEYWLSFSISSSVETEGWKEVTVPEGYPMDGDFATGFSPTDPSAHLAIDTNLITDRNWIQDVDQVWSRVHDRTFLIRAVVQYPTGEIEELEGKPISIYPNPAYESIHISLENNHWYTRLELINLHGQLIYSSELNGNEKSITLNRNPAWENGMYVVRLTGQDQVITKRIILK